MALDDVLIALLASALAPLGYLANRWSLAACDRNIATIREIFAR